jgi:3-hydroxyisobutyrate dehydrogenase
MVVDGPQVEAVLLGEHGAAPTMARGGVCLDMSTIAPSASRAIAQGLAERDISLVDAPVTGSRPKAEDGTLTIMVGGDPEPVARVRPLLDAMGELIVHVGPQGQGQLSKLIANTVTAINAAAMSEALTMARTAGLELDRWLTVARAGSSGSTMLELKAKPMVEHDFEPLFRLGHMLKDVRHCLDEARALGVELRLARVAEAMYSEAATASHADDDFAAVVTAAEAATGRASACRH